MTLPESQILDASILVVDDQEAEVRRLTQLLGDAGCRRISITLDPRQVCALHRQHAYDLILLDLEMPGMDGVQVMQDLRTHAAGDALPAIVLMAQPGHQRRALQAGARDVIGKPFDRVEVRTRIHHLLEVRLLYRLLAECDRLQEQAVALRTAELRDSEARFRGLAELASDWYWEQDDEGRFTRVSGPVLEMLGIRMGRLAGEAEVQPDAGWDEAERTQLQARIEARQPFLDAPLSRTPPGCTRQVFRVSGEPMFDRNCRFIGYRGIGVEVAPPHRHGSGEPSTPVPAA